MVSKSSLLGSRLAIVDGAPMPMAFVAGEAHIIHHVNRAFCLLVGKSESTLTGQAFSAVSPAAEKCLALLNRVANTGQAETHYGRDDTDSGSLYWSYAMWPVLSSAVGVEGIVVLVMVTTPFHDQAIAMNQALMIGSVRQHELTDAAEALNAQLQAEIVQRKHAEAELTVRQIEIRTSESLYRGLIEAIPQIVWTATPAGLLQFANSNWSDPSGTAFNHEGWASLLHPADEARSMDAWMEGLQSQSAFQMEHRLKDASTDTFRWYLSRAVPIRAESGELVKWIGTSTDIEEQKRAQLALANKQKLESLGVLAGGIAHDFNNLLCAILGNASLLASALPKSDSLQSVVGDIVSASDRAAHLTRQMLAYAGKGRFLIEQVDVADLVRSTCALINASIPRSVHLTLDAAPNLPPVDADSGQMQQVFMNLILNAAEAIDESSGGAVVVKVQLIERTAQIPEGGQPARKLPTGRFILVEVGDNGCGMDMATQSKIFDPFFTTKFTGRGLGLAAVEGILRSHAGAIEVASTLGIGATFRVYLPVSTRAKQSSRASEQPAGNGSNRTILIVDDDEMVRRVAKLSLESAGFSVRVADGGEEAMSILLSKPEKPISLVILDLGMPIMSGKQLMRRIRASGIQIPVLIASGYSEGEVFAEVSGLDIAGFISKPFTSRQLANRVSGILYPEQRVQ